MEPPVSGGDDLVRFRAPCEGLGFFFVVLLDEPVDGRLQVDQRMKDAVLQATLGQLGEEAFHGVQPGRRSRREVESPAGVTLQPGHDLWRLVGLEVVQHDMDDLPCGDFALQGV